MKEFNQESREFELLKSFLKKVNVKFKDIFKSGKLIKKSRFLYLVDNELFDYINETSDDFFSAGILLGEFKKYFTPSPEFSNILSKLSPKKIFVNKKSEWMFLCGKNILKKGIIKNEQELDRGLVFIQTELNENIGLGQFSMKNDGSIENIIDKGAYIRKEI